MNDSKPSRASAFGTGLIALDVVISQDATVPVRDSAGGTCGNVLTTLSFLGWDTYPIARLNGDAASLRVKADLRRWGVHLDYAECTPASPTPIIIQQILRDRNGAPRHRFAWSCPNCGKAWPKFLPVTAASVQGLKFPSSPPRVFFMDRLSRAAVDLAKDMASRGALIVFEPSARCDEKLWMEALRLTHILKYSRDRHTPLDEAARRDSSIHLEIQTLGADGLRFRSRLPRARTRDWVHLAALRAPHVADTCGAGDWCTAGLLDRIGRRGRRGLTSLTTSKLESALKHGQALAAWNCAFEGARGGMYEVDQRGFLMQVACIQSGERIERTQRRGRRPHAPLTATICPACS
jgi:sugar/nucleoside kinase (ribokinase family)